MDELVYILAFLVVVFVMVIVVFIVMDCISSYRMPSSTPLPLTFNESYYQL
ncbi:hypothetical protein OrNV_gp112 [Oryctes rhinoceros nudivirus]|uniref:Uncharacterized protein n=1 Tax=Oryctes rhinoceros nudivirus TaxID=92521 RepID=A0A6B9QR66_9VIRU|nr:hypothetical protein OrNV_gp112 [Oryctes rhinoceros nudivirus]ACH96242.1 unknown [Oryctes rhinoceros nudivirus]QHG11344.1 hypothetical protein SI_OrNV_gp112 [Oryctes rhinoceros nudivirus]QKE59574.1 hypothetical protein SI_OrNV_gp112 [Oryctes rhinoceros nudivirus]UBO76521.1 hypothetical protein SI_OrNV_gp112 [Oryctes rhinoceros nudivirus]WAQ80110.1 hypothetical protein LK20_00106 [Oryctes rhinoceros nudivirus]